MSWDEVEIDGQRYYQFEATVRAVGSAWSHNEDEAAFLVQHVPAMTGRPWVGGDYMELAARAEGDIIDRIDELVDDQLAGGEPRQGYNFNDPTYPKCPHCSRHWHGLPATERIAEMYAHGQFDESYRVDEDDSRVLCEGSEFIGPTRVPPWLVGRTAVVADETIDWLRRGIMPGSPAWLQEIVNATTTYTDLCRWHRVH